jgi:putative oxidoreductase
VKIVTAIARILLGVIFLVFGLNGFLHFIPTPPPAGLAGQFFTLLFVSHYYIVVFATQVVGGLLLLINRYVTLALVILGPVLVNILTFHVTMNPAGIGLGVLATILWTIVAIRNKHHLAGIFAQRSN